MQNFKETQHTILITQFLTDENFLNKNKKLKRDYHLAINYNLGFPWSLIPVHGVSYFHYDSLVYKYFLALQEAVNQRQINQKVLKNSIFLQALNKACYLQEHDPANKSAFYAQTTQLALIAARKYNPLLNGSWKKFNFEAGQHAEFCHLLSIASGYYFYQPDSNQEDYQNNQANIKLSENLFNDYLNKRDLQTNKYNIALSLKLFLLRKDKTTQITQLFDATLQKFFTLSKQNNQKEEEPEVVAAKLLLIATGLWNEIIDRRIYGEQKYSDLNIKDKPKFCQSLLKLDESTLKQLWLNEHIAAKLDFPAPVANLDDKEKLHITKNYSIINFKDFLFAIDKIPLGAGGQGEVKKAYKLDKQGNLFIEQLYALKFVKVKLTQEMLDKNMTIDQCRQELFAKMTNEANLNNQSNLKALQPIPVWEVKQNANETKLTSQQPYDPPTVVDEYIVLPVEFIPGKTAGETNSFKNLHELLQGKTLAQRARLAHDLMMAIANIHNNKILHGDLKGQNIQIDIRKNNSGKIIFDVKIFDPGIAKKLDNPNDLVNPIDFNAGTLNFVAPEIIATYKAYGVSDIYSCTALFAAIFKAADPLIDKRKATQLLVANIKNSDELLTKAIFSLAGLCDGLIANTNNAYLKNCIENFINRCQSQDPVQRPLDNEALAFLNNLAIVTEIIETQPEDIDQDIFDIPAAKIILISQGFWNKEIRSGTKYNAFDYEINPQICKDILSGYKSAISAGKVFDTINLEKDNSIVFDKTLTPDNNDYDSDSEALLSTISENTIESDYESENIMNSPQREHKQYQDAKHKTDELLARQQMLRNKFDIISQTQIFLEKSHQISTEFQTTLVNNKTVDTQNLIDIAEQILLQQNNITIDKTTLNKIQEHIEAIKAYLTNARTLANTTKEKAQLTTADEQSNVIFAESQENILLQMQQTEEEKLEQNFQNIIDTIEDKYKKNQQDLYDILKEINTNEAFFQNEKDQKILKISAAIVNFFKVDKDVAEVFKIKQVKEIITQEFKDYHKPSGIFDRIALTRSIVKFSEKNTKKMQADLVQNLEEKQIGKVFTALERQKQYIAQFDFYKSKPLRQRLEKIQQTMEQEFAEYKKNTIT